MKLLKSLALCLLGFLPPAAHAQSANLLPNASFEIGGATPAGWVVRGGGQTTWENEGHTGKRSISLLPDANGSPFWVVPGVKLTPNQAYRFSFWSKTDKPGPGAIISGPDTISHDFYFAGKWLFYSYVFVASSESRPYDIRLGQWAGATKIYFDDVSLTKITPLYPDTSQLRLRLGPDERVVGRTYRFGTQLDVTNQSRALVENSALFNTDRWNLKAGQSLVYRHQVGAYAQKSGRLKVTAIQCDGGKLVAEASRDGHNWVAVGELDKIGNLEADLPAALFPAKTVMVRLRAVGTGATTSLLLNGYSYVAPLDGEAPDGTGRVVYLEDQQTDLPVEVQSLGALRPGGHNVARFVVENRSAKPLPLEARLSFRPRLGAASTFSAKVQLKAGSNALSLPYTLDGAGTFETELTLSSGRPLYRSRAEVHIPALWATDFGYRLSSATQNDVWWAEAPYNVGRERPAPSRQSDAVKIHAARNEFEPFQVVLRPSRDVKGAKVSFEEFVGPNGARLGKENLAISEVAYVSVSQPTDAVGTIGEWPDPLPPLTGALDLKANRNQPLWMTVHVPTSATPGLYQGQLEIAASGWTRKIPVRLTVRDFALPAETHVQSAFGVGPDFKTYQNLTSLEDQKEAMDLYYQNCAQHRLSPFEAAFLHPIKVDFGVGNKTQDRVDASQVKLDFTDFDQAAHKTLDEYHFTAWAVTVLGLGSGRAGAYQPGRIGPYVEGSPQYETLFSSYLRQLQDHLERKGWLDKAYLYWYDEPDTADYPIVKATNDRIKKYAPKLTRMLTEEPEPELYGAVDLWCPIAPAMIPERAAERRKVGERVWWYVCTSPKEPYPTLFIDHPAVEMRTWLWQTWKYKLDGILVWQATWWNSGAAYPNSQQNPWQDPMSWSPALVPVSNATYPYGNGDGRFLYPPNRSPGVDKKKYLQGPVNSIRWEMLREGIEDYEYLYLLGERVKQAKARGAQTAAQKTALLAAEKLLQVPSSITTDATHFAVSPQPILAQREKIAAAIESLNAGSGSH